MYPSFCGNLNKHVKFASFHFTVCWWTFLPTKQWLVLTPEWTFDKDSDEVMEDAQSGAKDTSKHGMSSHWVVTVFQTTVRSDISRCRFSLWGSHSWEKNVGEQTLPEMRTQVFPCRWREEGPVHKSTYCVLRRAWVWIPRTLENTRCQETLKEESISDVYGRDKGVRECLFS